MKKNLRPLFTVSIFSILILITLSVIFLTPDFQATPVASKFNIELGNKIKSSPENYISCSNWSMPFTIVDTSKINEKEVGAYPITVYHGFQRFTYEAVISDTTPPEITSQLRSITIKKGDLVNLDTLGIQVQDKSKIAKCTLSTVTSSSVNLPSDSGTDDLLETAYRNGIEIDATTYAFSYGGKYQLKIIAIDEHNNVSEYLLKVTVEEPPVIEAKTLYYVTTNSTVDFSKYITTWDYLDTDYSIEDIKIDTSKLDLSNAGEYPVYFTGTDDYGLSTTITASVCVQSPNALQELINTHAISMEDNVIVGALNPYDNGYYTNESTDFIQEAVRPSLVHIYNTKLALKGSGYIIDISDEFVTIATNEHVISQDMNPEVYFSDTTLRYGSVVAFDRRNDIAFIRIPINDSGSETSISAEYVRKNLRTVHINEGYWNGLSNDAGITVCYNCINESGTSWHKDTGTMVEKLCVRDWNQYLEINETIISSTPMPGSSGSAIFDSQGKFIGMMRGYTNYDTYVETVVVPLNAILDYYEKTFGEKVQYQ